MRLNRVIIIAATTIFLAICALTLFDQRDAHASFDPTSPSVPPRTLATTDLPLVGVGMQIQRVDWIDRYKQSIDQITDIGADTVLLVVDARQENGTSSHIYLDMRMTPTSEQLTDLIQHAKNKGLRVILMPIVLLDAPRGNEWRGALKPISWPQWFDSYRDMIGHFAWIAQSTGVDVLVIGSELVTSEPQVDQWRQTIDYVRKTYKGRLTYSANWDHYSAIQFWDQLDLISMNSYYKLGDNRQVTIEQIQQRWKEIQKNLLAFQAKQGKPLVFLEVGWCSLANAASTPWDYTIPTEPIDLDLQRRLYEGFFLSWWGNPQLGGFMIWEWPPDKSGPSDRGYTPAGKPAEQVLRQWFAQPRWSVN